MMQNFITQPRSALAKKIGLILIATLLVGCTAARLGYSNGETLSYWWLNNYIDVESDQVPEVKKDLATLFAWHRKTQLKGYVQVMSSMQKRAQGNVTEAELTADYADFQKRMLLVADRALPEMTDLALAMRPQQIANLEKKFASNDEKYRKDFLRGDLEERQRFRYKKMLKNVEYWLGNMSSEQERLIRAASDARPLNNELVFADRQRRQAALIALLKKIQAEKPSREATTALLKNYIHSTVERTANAEHRAYFEASSAASVRLAAMVFNQATPEQKAHFVKTLQQWVEDFTRLAA
ncbi:MAG: DUF6279 family lipoprotein [Pseudomonadota bacterium]